MTLENKLVEPSSDGSLDKFSLSVRLKPSLGGSRICTITPYAAFIASIAPKGSPPKKIVSGGGVGNDTDSNSICGFFIDTYNTKVLEFLLKSQRNDKWKHTHFLFQQIETVNYELIDVNLKRNHLNMVTEIVKLNPVVIQLNCSIEAAK